MGDCHTLDDLNSVPGTHRAEGDSHKPSSDPHSRAVARVPAPNTWADASWQKQVTNEHINIIIAHEGNPSANYWRTSPHRLTPTIPTLNCRVAAGIPGHWLHAPLVKRQTVQPPRKVWQLLIKLNISIPYGLAVSLLDIILKETKIVVT